MVKITVIGNTVFANGERFATFVSNHRALRFAEEVIVSFNRCTAEEV
jgi:hypothetical protein